MADRRLELRGSTRSHLRFQLITMIWQPINHSHLGVKINRKAIIIRHIIRLQKNISWVDYQMPVNAKNAVDCGKQRETIYDRKLSASRKLNIHQVVEFYS